MGSSRKDLLAFPEPALTRAQQGLDDLCMGITPHDIKPMHTVGQGAYEIRIRIGTQWRVIYVANRRDVIFVLHCFQKTSDKTEKKDIDLAARATGA